MIAAKSAPIKSLPEGSIVVSVRCRGRMRRIALTPAGRMTILDHTDAERTLDAIGDAGRCRCRNMLIAWRRRDRSALPAALCDARPDRITALELRLRARLYGPLPADTATRVTAGRTASIEWPVATTLRGRCEIRVRSAVYEALDRTAYRQAGSAYRNSQAGHIWTAMLGEPSITGRAERVWPSQYDALVSYPGSASQITMTVRLGWLLAVYARGLSVIDGCAVAAIVEGDGAPGSIVLAGRQGRGYTVGSCRAKIVEVPVNGKGGKLRWLK